MDKEDSVFIEFKAYWQLSDELIANATKEDIAQAARILALQAAHYARKYGEHQLPDLADLLNATALNDERIGLLRDGTEALVGVLAMVTGEIGEEGDAPMQ